MERQQPFSNHERGQTQAEFGMLTLILAIVVIAILFLIGPAFAGL